MTLPNQTELRNAVFSRLDTYTNYAELPWIGTGADLAFADSVLQLGDWHARQRMIDILKRSADFHARPKEDDEEQTPFTMRCIKAENFLEVANMLEAL